MIEEHGSKHGIQLGGCCSNQHESCDGGSYQGGNRGGGGRNGKIVGVF